MVFTDKGELPAADARGDLQGALELSEQVNQAPAVDLNGADGGIDSAVTFTEVTHQGLGAGQGIALASAGTLADMDVGDDVEAVTVTLTDDQDGADEQLFVDPTVLAGGVTVSGNSSDTLVLTRNAATQAQLEAAMQAVVWQNDSNAPDTTPRMVTFVANDGDDESTTATATVTVQASNDAPVIGNSVAGGFYTEGGTPTRINSVIRISDADSATLASMTVSVGGPRAGDTLAATASGAITAGDIVYDADTFTLTITGVAPVADYQAVLRSVTFSSTSDDPNLGGTDNTRQFNISVSDGTDTTTVPINQRPQIFINAVNDDPTATNVPTSVTVTENVASAIDLSAIDFGDPDSRNNDITLTIAASEGTLAASDAGGVVIGGAGTGSITLTGRATEIDTYLNDDTAINYTSATDDRGAASATLTLTANDGGRSGTGGGTDVALGTVTVDVTEGASLVVTTAVDVVDAFDGETSLREAVTFANSNADGSTISFDASVFTGGAASVLRLTQGEIEITQATTIDGSTGTDIVITGDANDNDVVVVGTDITDVAASSAALLSDNSRLFNLSNGDADTSFDGLTLTGGHVDGAGGAIFGYSGSNSPSTFYSADVTLTNTTVSGNSTTGVGSLGGGIRAYNITATYSTVTGNSTTDAISGGGGLFADRTLTLTNTTVSGNSTAGAGSYGGGVGGGTVVLNSSTISGNSTTGANTTGGGIVANTAILTNTTVSGNSTTGDEARGGGIFAGSAILTNSTVSGNSTAGYAADGGGVAATNTTLTNSIVSGNLSAQTANDELFGRTNSPMTTLYGGNIVGGDVSNNGIVTGTTTTAALFASTQTLTVGGQTVVAGVLADNGGSVQTIALNADATNPALDVGNSSDATDAIGNARAFDLNGVDNGGPVDAGALELSPVAEVGTSGDDTLTGTSVTGDSLTGGAGNDTLVGNGGGDTLDGGTGNDTASYIGAPAGVQADLGRQSSNDFGATGDTYISIENLTGSAFLDDLRGDEFDNVLSGQGGRDYLTGRDGDDTLLGGDGDDVLDGGAGADVLNGGAGKDRADYDGAAGTAGVKADLRSAVVNTGNAAGDIYIDIEDLRGSDHDDDLRGDSGDNWLEGQGGDDILTGREGNDRFFGGEGRDILIGGDGADVLTGNAGNDFFVYNQVSEGGDTIIDFQIGRDTIRFEDAGFTSLTRGAVSADNFTDAGTAQDADDFLVYDTVTGELYYDVDGDGTEAAILVATMANLAALNADDFLVL